MHYAYNDRYFVDTACILEHQQYKYFFDFIERGGITYVDDSQEKTMIYNPYLATLLYIQDLPVYDQIERVNKVIDGRKFYKYYKKGFHAGLAKFDEDYTPAKNFIKELHRKYYGDGSGWHGDDCVSKNNRVFTDLSTAEFQELGFWAGLTYRIKEVIKDYPVAFEELSKSILKVSSEPEIPTEPDNESDTTIKAKSLTHPQIAILHYIIGQIINKNNAEEIAKKYGQTSGQRLRTTYEALASRLTRTGKGKNRIADYKKLELLIPDGYKELYKKELKDAEANNK